MKSVLIIGLGRFGHHLCKNMIRLRNEVMVVDKVEANVEDLPDSDDSEDWRLHQ